MPFDPPRKVHLPGHGTFWLLLEGGGGPLAPLDHCDEQGHVKDLATAIHGESYAHVGADGVIRRYRREIGRLEDLVDARDSIHRAIGDTPGGGG